MTLRREKETKIGQKEDCRPKKGVSIVISSNLEKKQTRENPSKEEIPHKQA